MTSSRHARVSFWHDSAKKRRAGQGRSVQVVQTSTCSAIVRASSTFAGEVAIGPLDLETAYDVAMMEHEANMLEREEDPDSARHRMDYLLYDRPTQP